MNSKYLYLLIDLVSLSIPLLASFYPKAPFYKKWKYLIWSILIPAVVFIVWDILFTKMEVWGFNEKYLTGYYFFNLPIEEILFFICIPYACLFTYEALNFLVKKDYFYSYQKIISIALIIVSFVIGFYNLHRLYTATTFLFLSLFLFWLLILVTPKYLGRFYFSFLIILIPFFLVNGILTGSFIEGEVVWYTYPENLDIRIGTIPVEDIFYGMLLIMMNVSIFEWFQRK